MKVIYKYLNEGDGSPKNKKISEVLRNIDKVCAKHLNSEFSSSGCESINQRASWGEFATSDEAYDAEKKLKSYLETFNLKELGITYTLKHWHDDRDKVWITKLLVNFPIKPLGSKTPRSSYYD